METSERTLKCLRNIFSNRVIYHDKLNQLLSENPEIQFDIRTACRSEHISKEIWLEKHGFDYRKIESYMISQGEAAGSDSPLEVWVDSVFHSRPVLGDVVLPPNREKELYQRAIEIFKKCVFYQIVPTLSEANILTLETVLMLRNRQENEEEDDSENSGLWQYCFTQYCCSSEFADNTALQKRGHDVLQEAIKYSLLKEKRFLIPKHVHGQNFQRYYSTLMAHAMAPVQSIESLFKSLFQLYSESLECQYIPEDPAFEGFVKSYIDTMRARRNSSFDRRIKVTSEPIFSGLQALFEVSPKYMEHYCASIVEKIDALTSGGNTSRVIRPDIFYTDELLLQWYQSENSIDRAELRKKREKNIREYVAVRSENIHPYYHIDEAKAVILSLPRIRFPVENNQDMPKERPEITILKDDAVIRQEELSVFGKEILTSRPFDFAVNQAGNDTQGSFHYKVYIKNNGITFYDSKENLYRNFLLFNQNGREISKITEAGEQLFFLFAPEDSPLLYRNLQIPPVQYPGAGKLYQFALSGNESILVNKHELRADKSAQSGLHCYENKSCIADVRYSIDQGLADLYAEAFSVSVCLPPEKHAADYKVDIDHTIVPLNQYHGEQNDIFILPVPAQEGPHLIKIIEVASSQIVYEKRYAIFRDFHFAFEQAYYLDRINQIRATVRYGGKIYSFESRAQAEDDYISVHISEIDGDFLLYYPVIRISVLGESSFDCSSKKIWCGEIASNEILSISLPPKLHGCISLGTKELPYLDSAKGYEIGNEILTYNPGSGRSAELTLKVTGKDYPPSRLLIAEIFFRESFRTAPLRIVENSLMWDADGNFIGGTDASFRIRFEDGNLPQYSATLHNRCLKENIGLQDGGYPYEVLLLRDSIFSAEPECVTIFSGILYIGDPDAFRFRNVELSLVCANYWDNVSNTIKSVNLDPSAVRIIDMKYCGKTSLKFETGPTPNCYPKYDTTLVYWDSWKSKWIPFSSNERDKDCELINPIAVWVLNNHYLYLETITKDPVYLDLFHHTILNQAENLCSQTVRKALQTPDEFGYSIVK